MDIVAQWIHTSWTKRSRGGKAAARRNAVPVGFAVPDAPPPFAHVVRMWEHDDFQPTESIERLAEIDVVLRERDGRLRVLPRVSPFHGVPPRRRRPPAVRLAPGSWVRWQLNYRYSSFAGMQDWSYWLDTFNVAYGAVDPDVFLGQPTYVIDEQGPVR